MKTLEQGMHAGVPMDDYINDPAPEPSLSTGTAKAMIDECPAHARYRHPRLNPAREDDSNGATDIGNMTHDLILEGSLARMVVVQAEDWRTKAAKEERIAARAAGKCAILAKQLPKIEGMYEAAIKAFALAKAEIGFDLHEMLIERTMIWQRECDVNASGVPTGVWCRSRPDMITPDFKLAIDYKSTATSAHPNAVAKLLLNNGYDLQGALFRDGIYTMHGKTPDVVFMVQEVEAPFLVSFVGMAPAFSGIADNKLKHAAKRWQECLASGQWPGYPSRVAWVEPPPWEVSRAEFLGFGS